MPEAMDELRDFEIRIEAAGDGAHRVSVHVSPDDRRADESVQLPYSEQEITEALRWMEQGLFDETYVKEFGTRLFDSLFVGSIRTIYDACVPSADAPLRFRLIIDAPEVARIPWELTYDSGRQAFLALQAPLVRGISVADPTHELVARPPLRVLVADAFPSGIPRVEGQIEAAGIQSALSGLRMRSRVEVRALPNATLRSLLDALREAAGPEQRRPIHVLHFIGHGRFDTTTARGTVLLEKEDGTAHEVDAETLSSIVRDFDLKLVFLNACETGESGGLDAARAFAPALLRIGIPAFIGMQATVLDEVAVQLSRDFYDALADGRPVDQSLADARRLINSTQRRRKGDVGIPVCYLRAESGRILQPQPSRRRMRAAAAAAVVLAIGVSLFFVLRQTPPPKMDGDFNVAVARFRSIDEHGKTIDSPGALSLANSVYRSIVKELTALDDLDPQFRAPADVRQMNGGSAGARAASAARIAEELNADIVIYGHLRLGDDESQLAPEFYLRPGTVEGADELAGQHDFGGPIAQIGGPRAASRGIRTRLTSRTVPLAELVVGLTYYSVEEYRTAITHFRATASAEGLGKGREVAYLFLGNAAGRAKDIDLAEDSYEEALDLDPDYGRARLGRAEVRFQRAKGSCDQGTVDRAGLKAALQGFRDAAALRDQPPLSDIKVKSALGTGRVYLCQSQALLADRWGSAERAFQEVIDTYERGEPFRLREFAAEAHGNLGFIALPSKAERNEDKYRAAAEQYDEARRLAPSDPRKAFFGSMLGFIYGRLRDYDEAVSHYREAIELDRDPDHDKRYRAAIEALEKERAGR